MSSDFDIEEMVIEKKIGEGVEGILYRATHKGRT